MNLIKNLLILSLLLSTLSACVELRDPDKDKNPQTPEAQTQAFAELLVDRPLFLVEGRWLSAEDIQDRLDHHQDIDWTPATYEMKYDKITFTEQGVLYTEGNEVSLQVTELESFHGQIASFPEATKAAEGEAGRSGGNLSLQIERASGSLTLTMRGENGGDGESVPQRSGLAVVECERPDAIPGGNGQMGGATGKAIIQVRENNPLRFDLYVQKQAGLGGNAGQSLEPLVCGFQGKVTYRGKALSQTPQAGPNGAVEHACTQIGSNVPVHCE